MVVETQNFLELQFDIVLKILASSDLNCHSELEVFDAASNWLKHHSEERIKFAKQLLLTVRLPLLSDYALKHLSTSYSSFIEHNECVDILKATSVSKEKHFRNKSSNYYTSRYCNQNKFNMLICSGYDKNGINVENVKQIDGSNLNNVKDLPSIKEERSSSKAVCIKGEVYVFGGIIYNDTHRTLITSVEKYSPSSNTWNRVADIYDYRQCYCACGFIDKIFVIGGYNVGLMDTKSCLQFDTKDNRWKEVAPMNESRLEAACTVFEGNIVVSGGTFDGYLNTVESYDVIADKWSSMPNMVNGKSSHSLVVVRNKLFVIGDYKDTCEVFDNNIRKFVVLKSPEISYLNTAVSIGSKIVIFQHNTSSMSCYDADKNEWSEEPCELTEHLCEFSCAKFPRY